MAKKIIDGKEVDVIFEPFPGGQMDALSNPAQELLIGSVLGCGKSLLLLMFPTRYIDLPHFNCIILRSSFPELEQGLIKMSKEFYPYLKGTYKETNHTWTFPSGATISFGYLESLDDIRRYRGIERQMICYDELSSFDEEVYLMMNAWLRTSKGPQYEEILKVVATSNPGGKYGDWILRRWNNWLSKRNRQQLKSGQVARIGDSRTRSCVILGPQDNPKINRKEYERQFIGLPLHIVKQLKEGDWDARPSLMEYFRRDRMALIYAKPAGKYVRGWDLASSVKATADYTASVKICRAGKQYAITDYFRYRKNTAQVEQLILDTARADGNTVKQVLSIDPGQAGEAQKMYLSQLLKGYHFEFVRDQRKKVERAKPVSSQVLAGQFSIIQLPNWYEQFMQELEDFSDDDDMYLHDDFVDALSIAFNTLLTPGIGFRSAKSIGIDMDAMNKRRF